MRRRTRGNVYVHFQERAFHPFRVGNAFLLVDGITLGNNVHNFVIVFNRHGFGVFDGKVHIGLGNFFIHAGNVIRTVVGKRFQMRAPHAHVQAADFLVAFALDTAQHMRDGGGGFPNVGHHTAL